MLESQGPVLRKENNENGGVETLVESLKGLTGLDFVTRLKQIKEENPGFVDGLANIKGDKRYIKDLLMAIDALDRNDDEWNAKWNTPAYYRSSRRQNRRIFGGLAAAIVGLGTTAGVMYYQFKQNLDSEKIEEKNWEIQKLKLSLSEIEQQADTIFQNLNGNHMLFHAYDTLRTTVDREFDKELEGIEGPGVEEIQAFLDSLESENPELYKSLTFEYYKLSNDLPSSYIELANKIGGPIAKTKDRVSKEKSSIEKRRNNLQSKLRKAYEKTSGEFLLKEGLKSSNKKEVNNSNKGPNLEKEDSSLSQEELDFQKYIDSLTNAEREEFNSVASGLLSVEVDSLEKNLKELQQKIAQEKKDITNKLNSDQRKAIQDLQAQEGGELNNALNQYSESFGSDTWAYMEDIYLTQEVFNEDSGMRDTVSENELKVLKEDPTVNSDLDSLNGIAKKLKSNLDNKIKDLKLGFQTKKEELLAEIDQKYNLTLSPLNEQYKSKKAELGKSLKDAYAKYRRAFVAKWNEELKKLGNTSIKPISE